MNSHRLKRVLAAKGHWTQEKVGEKHAVRLHNEILRDTWEEVSSTEGMGHLLDSRAQQSRVHREIRQEDQQLHRR